MKRKVITFGETDFRRRKTCGFMSKGSTQMTQIEQITADFYQKRKVITFGERDFR